MTKRNDGEEIAVLKEQMKEIRYDISEIKEALQDMRKSSELWKWFFPTITGVITAVGTFLIIYFLRGIK